MLPEEQRPVVRLKGDNSLEVCILVLILIIGAAARMTGIGFGLPHTETRPDESTSISVAMHMAKSGLHPHFFTYPTLYPTALLALYSAYFMIGYFSGRFGSLEDFKLLYYTDPSSFFLIARTVGALSGIATISLLYLLGKRLYGRSVGLLAALFLALCPIHVRESHFAKVDVPMTCLMVLAAVFILDLYRRGGIREYLLSGLVSGLATSTKYNAGALCFSIVIAHLLREPRPGWSGWRRPLDPRLLAAALTMVAGFIIGSPYALIDWPAFVDSFRQPVGMLLGEYGVHGARDYGPYGTGWAYHAVFSFRYGLGPVMEILALVGLLWAIVQRRAVEILLLSFLIQFAFLGNGRWIFARYVIPLVPVMMIFAAAVLLRLSSLVKGRVIGPAVVCGIVVLALAQPLYGIVRFDRLLLQEDTRLQAAAWIRENIPDGSVIALHGGYYAEPQLPESPEMIRERLRGQPGPNRDAHLLAHPVSPSYDLVRLGYFDTADRTQRTWTEMSYDLGRLRSRSVDYLVVQDSPLRDFAFVDERISDLLDHHAELLAVFDPFAFGAHSSPVFDPIDAFFVPMAGYDGMVRPGPEVRVYRLHQEG